jgi:uncharacterized protein YfcZ (UPF0381/DUF406 family)
MKLYIVTLFDPNHLTEKIIKVFSTKENLDRWLENAKLMCKELYGDANDITQQYKIKEAELDNLDFIELLSEARGLGAQVKPSQPQ